MKNKMSGAGRNERLEGREMEDEEKM